MAILKSVGRSAAQLLNRVLRSGGLEVRSYNFGNTGLQAKMALSDPKIDLFIDVGGNLGDFARSVLKLNAHAKVMSFEPEPQAFKAMELASRSTDRWTVYNVALGSLAGQGTLNVAGNSESSSLLVMNKAHIDAAPNSITIRTNEVQIMPLDNYLSDAPVSAYLKIDAQGYEGEVLGGARKMLRSCRYVQLELSFTKLYEGAPSSGALIQEMEDFGFELVTINPVFSDRRRARLLQADAIFARVRD